MTFSTLHFKSTHMFSQLSLFFSFLCPACKVYLSPFYFISFIKLKACLVSSYFFFHFRSLFTFTNHTKWPRVCQGMWETGGTRERVRVKNHFHKLDLFFALSLMYNRVEFSFDLCVLTVFFWFLFGCV